MDGWYDVVIVGGGVVGCHCARELSRYDLRVLLLEKEADVCSGASKANSGIVHPALSPKVGSLKARLCLEGNRMMRRVCQELGVAYRQIGALTVALREDELPALRSLKAQGERNGELNLRLVAGEELQRLEPELNRAALAALFAPTAAIVDPFMLTIAAAENAVLNGADVLLQAEVVDIIVEAGRVRGVVTSKGEFQCRYLVNAAGLHADEVMQLAGMKGFRITPRRGDYFVLDKMHLVEHVIFPLPTLVSKGILITPTVHGNILLGPTSVLAEERDDPPVVAEGLAEVSQHVRMLVPSVNLSECIAVFAGVRPSGADDFIIEMAKEPLGLLNLAGIESPGLTSAPAIARLAVSLLAEAGLELEPKSDFNPIREAPPRVSELCLAEREALVRRDPRYGRVICRCEGVTEGEIVAAIHSPIPATTLDAIKKRTRAMSGRCQGGFDTPLIIEILARECGMEPWQVSKKGPGSEVLTGPTGVPVASEALG